DEAGGRDRAEREGVRGSAAHPEISRGPSAGPPARLRESGRHRGADVRDRQSGLDRLAEPGDAGGGDRGGEATASVKDERAMLPAPPFCRRLPGTARKPEASR